MSGSSTAGSSKAGESLLLLLLQNLSLSSYRDAEELMIMSLSNRDRSIKNYPENAEIENVSSDSDCSCRSYRSPGYKPAKWPRTDRLKTTVDRLSELPDHVLVHMLSLLPIKEAIQTQVLSRRWKSPWTYLPSLHFHLLFNFHVSVRDIQRFVTFVDETLIRSNRSKLEKFEVLCFYNLNFASDVNRWTTFAVGKGTKELHLFLPLAGFDSGSNECYELPQYLYTNSSFRDLRFSWCSVTPEGVVAWNSLTRLTIGCVTLSEDVIHKILAGSPVLEILELYNFKGFNRLRVSNSSVKKLILRNVWPICTTEEYMDSSELEISAPNLRSLEITGRLALKSYLLGDVSSLVDATLKFDLTQCDDDRSDDYERISSILQGLLVSLVHIKNITLGTWALQVLSTMETKALHTPPLECKRLTLDTSITKSVLPGIAYLLESLPHLEKLVITECSSCYIEENIAEFCAFDEKQYWTSQNRTFACLTLHLREVKFAGLRWYDCDSNFFSFVQFLLENASVMETMVVDLLRKDGRPSMKFFQQLLSLPRSSPKAAVVLLYQ